MILIRNSPNRKPSITSAIHPINKMMRSPHLVAVKSGARGITVYNEKIVNTNRQQIRQTRKNISHRRIPTSNRWHSIKPRPTQQCRRSDTALLRTNMMTRRKDRISSTIPQSRYSYRINTPTQNPKIRRTNTIRNQLHSNNPLPPN